MVQIVANAGQPCENSQRPWDFSWLIIYTYKSFDVLICMYNLKSISPHEGKSIYTQSDAHGFNSFMIEKITEERRIKLV